MSLLRGLHQAIYFLLELSMFFGLGYSGIHLSQHSYGKYLLGIGLPILAILLWGYFAAPRSAHRLSTPYLHIFALILFGVTTFLLYRIGQTRLAFTFGLVALITETISIILKE